MKNTLNNHFKQKMPKIFFINFSYFLGHEIQNALTELQCPFLNFEPNTILKGKNLSEILQHTIFAILKFKPDLVLTINSNGIDNSGFLSSFLEKHGIPLIVWFVDNPELFIIGKEKIYPHNSLFFTCDPHGPQKVKRLTDIQTHVLPLAADKKIFQPISKNYIRSVSFVGSTWTSKIAACHKNFSFPRHLLLQSAYISNLLAEHQPADGIAYIRHHYKNIYNEIIQTLSSEDQNGFWHLVYWEANRIYRKTCLEKTLTHNPLIAGDKYWKSLLPDEKFEFHPPIAYGNEVFKLYSLSCINFSCSSIQMSAAVTQRVFDIPASGGFVITDTREQLNDLFDADKESASYSSKDEINYLIEKFLKDEKQRISIIKNARLRIAKEHTYLHRVKKMIMIARDSY
ncbi:Glycosyl transferases group 1 [anaerobic digester metagenome]